MVKRYLTKGVMNEIPTEIQLLCWECYDQVRQRDSYDYLQVFELRRVGVDIQEIEHRQEVPRYKQVYYVHCKSPRQQKIYIIEELDTALMMLAEEY